MASPSRAAPPAATWLAGTVLAVVTAIGWRAEGGEAGARDKYILFCAGCHGIEGEGGGGGGGMKRIFPFADGVGVFLNDSAGRAYLANVGGVTSSGMTEAETAEVLNYILSSFGRASTPASFVPYTTEEIRAFRKDRVDDPLALRREIGARLRKAGLRLPPYEWD